MKTKIKNLFSLLKMDLHRLIRSKCFYVLLALAVVFPIMMFTSMKGNVTDAASMIGPVIKTAAASPLELMSGIGLLNIMVGIFLAIFIGTEYQTGSIKNVMTVHSDKKEYIISKGIIGIIVSVSLMVIYILAIAVVGAIAGMPLQLPSAGGFVLFLIERLFTSIAFTMMFVFLGVTFRRSYGFGILGAGVLGMGIISMLLSMLAGLGNGIPFFNWVNRLTIFGSGSYATLTANGLYFLNVVLVAVVWSVIYGLGSSLMLRKRDLI